MERSRRREVRAWVNRTVPAPWIPARIHLSWPRRAGHDGGPGTGDLRFDGVVCAEGPDWRLSAWLGPDLRRALLDLAAVGPGALRVAEGQLCLHAGPGRPGARPSVLPKARILTEWAHRLTRAMPRLLAAAQTDPDPRARAVAARRLLERLRGREAWGAAQPLTALLVAPGLPDWIALEAFFRLWREYPDGRRRWAQTALARGSSGLGRVATQAVLWSDMPLDALARSDPTRVATEIHRAWRRASAAERARLRGRVEDLPAPLWTRIQAAAGRSGASLFAALSKARRGRLSVPDLLGGELAVEPDGVRPTGRQPGASARGQPGSDDPFSLLWK